MFYLENLWIFQKQPPEVFYEKTYSEKFCSIHKKVAGLELIEKETPTQLFSSEYCEFLKNTYLEEHLLMAASDFLKQLQNAGEIIC